MAKLPEKKLLDGSKTPRTSTKEMRHALGELHDYLAGLLGTDSADTKTARETLGIDLDALDGRMSGIEEDLSIHATKAEVEAGLDTKQDTLVFDTEPVEGSPNPVTSDGIKTYIERQVNSGKAIVNADWNATSGYAEILNRPALAPVATSGSYNDLEDRPQTLKEYGLKEEVRTDIETAVHDAVPEGGKEGQALVVGNEGKNRWENVAAENVTFDRTGTTLASTDANSAIAEVDRRIPVDSRVRNTVLCGRQKDGMPAFLATHETCWMPTFKNTAAPGDKPRPGVVADVFCSSTYANSATYSHEIPLVNQKAVLHAQRYITPAAVTEGYWGVNLKEPQAFTMLEIVYAYGTEIPQTIQVQATHDDNWENPVNLTGTIANKKFGVDNLSYITKDYARRYWFNDNVTAYKSYRLLFGAAMTPTTYSGSFLAIRFFRHPDTTVGALNKNDAMLVSNEKEPFVASVAKGLDGDQKVFVNSSIIIPGSYLSELSRNYCYIVPANEDGTCPDYVNVSRAIKLENDAWLVIDHRKINYGEQAQVEKQCMVNYRCDLDADPSTADFTFSADEAGQLHGLRRGGVTISEDDHFRGSKSCFVFPSAPGGGSWILPDVGSFNAAYHQNTIDPRAKTTAGTQDWTFEADLKYGGPSETNDDAERTIFDFGYSGGSGNILVYAHRRGHFSLYNNGNWFFKWPYVMDDQWHSIALTHRNGNVYLHVDGKCLGAYTGHFPMKRGCDYWCVGRQAVSNVVRWTGNISSFRYIIGDALYCSDDYTPSPVFHTSMIPDKTLWYDHLEGIVKTWDAENRSWRKTPMCPIGHIDTLYQEHLHSEAPRGMQSWYGIQNVRNISSSGDYSGSYPPAAAFNFGNGALDWICANNNLTVEHWLKIELESPMSFDRLRMVALSSAITMWAFPAVFLWQGSQDGEEWTTLIDRSTFVRDGNPSNGLNPAAGANVWWFGGMKQFDYDNETAFRFYRLFFPAKKDIPYYNSVAYTGMRLQLPLRGETPEIASCTSYAIGGIYTVGPFMARTNQEIEIPVPFGGAPFEIDGDVEERFDWQSKRRKIGHSGNYPNNNQYNEYTGRVHYGEVIYSKTDSAVIYTGQYLTTLLGSWNVPSLNSASDLADYTITFRRKF